MPRSRSATAIVMLADEFPDMGHLGPKARGGTTVSLMIYVEDVDSAFKQAIEAGGKEERPVENQFWGDRMGTLSDPFGHKWSLGDPRRRSARERAAGADEGVDRQAEAGRAGLNQRKRRRVWPAPSFVQSMRAAQALQAWLPLPGRSSVTDASAAVPVSE